MVLVHWTRSWNSGRGRWFPGSYFLPKGQRGFLCRLGIRDWRISGSWCNLQCGWNVGWEHKRVSGLWNWGWRRCRIQDGRKSGRFLYPRLEVRQTKNTSINLFFLYPGLALFKRARPASPNNSGILFSPYDQIFICRPINV